MQIAIYASFENADAPIWTGSVAQYQTDNDLSASEVREILDDLGSIGEHRVGGGAAGEFVIRKA